MYLEGRDRLVVSAIDIFELYKVLRRDFSEEHALEATAAMRRAEVIPVDETLALEAADRSLAHRLAIADAIVYATARRAGAILVTGDTDFDNLPDVVMIR